MHDPKLESLVAKSNADLIEKLEKRITILEAKIESLERGLQRQSHVTSMLERIGAPKYDEGGFGPRGY